MNNIILILMDFGEIYIVHRKLFGLTVGNRKN
jgi:hypothetical protein